MQVLWMLLITLVLALSGVLGLAVVTHAAARPGAADPTPEPSTALQAPLGVDARRSRFPCLLNYAHAYYLLHSS
jgi:hypothetical protein